MSEAPEGTVSYTEAAYKVTSSPRKKQFKELATDTWMKFAVTNAYRWVSPEKGTYAFKFQCSPVSSLGEVLTDVRGYYTMWLPFERKDHPGECPNTINFCRSYLVATGRSQRFPTENSNGGWTAADGTEISTEEEVCELKTQINKDALDLLTKLQNDAVNEGTEKIASFIGDEFYGFVVKKNGYTNIDKVSATPYKNQPLIEGESVEDYCA